MSARGECAVGGGGAAKLSAAAAVAAVIVRIVGLCRTGRRCAAGMLRAQQRREKVGF
jgi:hypothetical protein